MESSEADLHAAGQLQDVRHYFGSSFYFVPANYALNFYSLENLMNLDIKYCTKRMTPSWSELNAENTCDDFQPYFSDVPPILDEGAWVVWIQTKNHERAFPLYFMVEKICSGEFSSPQLIKELGCTSVGSLRLSGDPDLSELVGLSRVEGQLVVEKSSVESLDGLQNLNRVGSFVIQGNPNLRSLTGLSYLNVLSDLEISASPSLRDLTALEKVLVGGRLSLTSIGASELNFLRPEQFNSIKLDSLSSLKNIAFLENVEIIQGDLEFIGLHLIQSLEDLKALQIVNGNFRLEDMPINNLRGLENLKRVGEDFSLNRLRNLQSIEQLGSLVHVSSLELVALDMLIDLEALTAISQIRNLKMEYLEIRSLPDFQFDPYMNSIELNLISLADIKSLHNVKSVGNLTLRGSAYLSSLDGLESLVEVKGALTLGSMHELVDFGALSNLKKLGHLNISHVPITNLNAFSSITNLNGLFLRDLEKMSSLQGLENLEFISRGSLVLNNLKINSLAPLGNLRTVEGSLILSEINGLRNLTGLTQLETIGSISLTDLDSLESFKGLDKVIEVGDVYFANLPKIQSFEGLNSLRTVGDDFVLYLQGLESFEGLDRLEFVGGDLSLNGEDEPPVRVLSGLNSLKIIRGNLTVDYFPELRSISGFNQLELVGGRLSIPHTFSLSRGTNVVALDGLSNLKQVHGEILIPRDACQLNSAERNWPRTHAICQWCINDQYIYYWTLTPVVLPGIKDAC